MKRTSKVMLGLVLVITLGIGFFLGKTVQAETTQPGSAADPLVSQSYVDKQVVEKAKEMELIVQELQAKASALEEKIKLLESKAAQ